MTERTIRPAAPDGGPVADFAIPDAVGLCPDHGGEFYLR